jgi:hypothetical protein
MHLFICGSTALCWILVAFSVSWYFRQSVGPLGRGISPAQGRYLHTEQHKHRINAYRHPCLKWDWNPRPQCSSGRRRVMPETVRPLWAACMMRTVSNILRRIAARKKRLRDMTARSITSGSRMVDRELGNAATMAVELVMAIVARRPRGMLSGIQCWIIHFTLTLYHEDNYFQDMLIKKITILYSFY